MPLIYIILVFFCLSLKIFWVWFVKRALRTTPEHGRGFWYQETRYLICPSTGVESLIDDINLFASRQPKLYSILICLSFDLSGNLVSLYTWANPGDVKSILIGSLSRWNADSIWIERFRYQLRLTSSPRLIHGSSCRKNNFNFKEAAKMVNNTNPSSLFAFPTFLPVNQTSLIYSYCPHRPVLNRLDNTSSRDKPNMAMTHCESTGYSTLRACATEMNLRVIVQAEHST